MLWVLVPQDRKSFGVLLLLDVAVGGKVPTLSADDNEVVLFKEVLCSCVIAGREMDLGEPESILWIIW